MSNILFQSINGKVFKCGSCAKVHVEYNNLNFNFTTEEYKRFATYIQKLDGSFWESKNQTTQYRRKILIPVGHKNINLLLNNSELKELKDLLQPLNAVKVSRQNITIDNQQSYLFLN